MPLRLVPLVNDYYYHVYNRGVNKRPIFSNKRDYSRVINLMKFYVSKNYPIRFSKFLLLSTNQRREIWEKLEKSEKYTEVICYCLMPNHFHFLLKQKIDNGISKFIANFQNSYTKYFNTKYKRIGPLLQGPFKAKKIDSENQLLHLSRYIHLNPYTSAIVGNVEDLLNYKWSSLGEYATKNQFEFCFKETTLSYFKDKESYREFVLDNADYQRTLEDIKHLTFD